MKKNDPQENNLDYQLLDDSPSEKDKFGAHGRIAGAIATLIKSNKGGKTIALLGEWGSGKSTTIKQLQKKLDGNHMIFTYDAWVHSGDHLRKAFLNEFINALLDNKWLIQNNEKDKKYWDEEKEKLAGRLKITSKTTEPEFTKHGKVIIPSILLLPIATVFFNNLIQGYIKDQYFFTSWHVIIHIFTILSFAAICFPFAYIFWYLYCEKTSAAKVLSLILNKSTFKEQTTTLEQPEATTLEFQEIFKKVICQALNIQGKETKRKIIIVIDNLDRVDKEEAQNIWSLLRGFIDNPSHKKNEKNDWFSSVWVIVPLANNKSYQSAQNEDNAKVEEQFLEKIFQVRFHLPPPAQSDWRKYLEAFLKETFPSETNKQYSLILRLYESFIFDPASNKKTPTPRELTIFINDLIVLTLQWKKHFDIATCAAYVLTFNKEKNDFLKKLQGSQIPSTTVKRILNADPTKKFAALYFNIEEIEKANSILLKPVVENVLKLNDSESLKLMLNQSPDLKDLLENIIDDSLSNWALDQPEEFFNAIITIAIVSQDINSGGANLLPDEIKELIVQRVNYALKITFKAFPFMVKNSVEAVIKISNLQTDIDLKETVINSVKRLSKIPSQDSGLIYPKLSEEDVNLTWVSRLQQLFENNIYKSGFVELGKKSILLPISFNGWIKLCKDSEDKSEFMNIIYPNDGESIIKDNLIAAINSSFYRDEYFFILQREFESDNFEYWIDDFTTSAIQSLASGRIDSTNMALLGHIVFFRKKSTQIDNILLDANTNGYLGHMFFESYRNQHLNVSSICLLSILIKNPQLVSHPGLGYSQNGIQQVLIILQQPENYVAILEGLLERIKHADEYRVLIDLALQNPNSSSILNYLISKLGDRSNIYKKFNVSDLLNELNAYTAMVTDIEKVTVFREVINIWIEDQQFIEHLKSSVPTMGNIMFYSLVLENKKLKNKVIINNYISFLKLIDATTWLSNIRTYTWLVKVVMDISSRVTKLNLLLPLREALSELMKEAERAAEQITIDRDEILKIQSALSVTHHKNYSLDVYEFAAQPDRNLTEKFWQLFGDILEEATLALGKDGRSIRRLIKPIVSKQDLQGIKWTINLLEKTKISSLDEDRASKADLKDTLNHQLKSVNKDDNIYHHLEELIILINKK